MCRNIKVQLHVVLACQGTFSQFANFRLRRLRDFTNGDSVGLRRPARWGVRSVIVVISLAIEVLPSTQSKCNFDIAFFFAQHTSPSYRKRFFNINDDASGENPDQTSELQPTPPFVMALTLRSRVSER